MASTSVTTKTVVIADDTAFVRDRFRTAVETAGHKAIVVKSAAELLARVRAAIRRPHGHKAATLSVDDLEIDTVAKTVRRAGKQIELTAREYALLEYLAHREGQVVSRTDIWEQLYGQEDATTSNVVDVYIGYLRAKIDRDHPVKLIHTRRGLGYVLTATP